LLNIQPRESYLTSVSLTILIFKIDPIIYALW
jgi:hypothetical protein